MRSLVLATAFFCASAAASAQTLPVADAGDDQSFPCAPASGAQVTLDGTGSSDPDDANAILTYTWSGDALGLGVTVDGAAPTVTIAPGVHTLTLTVDDGVDGTATDTVQVTVVADVDPPQLTLVDEAHELWPPNHKFHAFSASDLVAAATDACDVGVDAADAMFARATSDEPDNGKGDGNTTGDVSFEVGCAMALVRSERAGPEDGRVYQLTVAVQDAAGNAAEAVATVTVPHDRAHAAVDSGADAEYTAEECGPIELCPPAPSDVCLAAPEAKVEIDATGKSAPALRWRARGFAAAEDEFSNPAVDYQLCVYTDGGEAAVLAHDPRAPRGSGWSHKKHGASFRGSRSVADDAIDGLKLAEKRGEGALSLSLKEDADLPDLPLAEGTALVLQLQDSEGDCVGSTFEAPEVNDGDRFSAEVGGD
jgi:hypothetical protein